MTPKSSPAAFGLGKGPCWHQRWQQSHATPAASRESLTGDTAKRCHHAPSTRWDRSTRTRARTIKEQLFRHRLEIRKELFGAPPLRRHHPRQPGVAYLATAKVYSDIEAVEIVFKDGKDGLGYDLRKLIESGRGLVGLR